MADVGWDDDDFEPTDTAAAKAAAKIATDKWDGEDEDDDVKDAWDKSSDEDDDPDKPKAVQRKKKKKLADIIAEKEAAKASELENRAAEAAAKKQMNTPEAKMAEKARLQKMEENANLMLAKDMMGLKMGSIDAMIPVDKEDFNQFEKALTEKITMYSNSTHYPDFMATLVKNLSVDLNAASLKKIKMDVEAMHNAKLKLEKAQTAKKNKGGGKAGSLKMDTSKDIYTPHAGADYTDMDDFM